MSTEVLKFDSGFDIEIVFGKEKETDNSIALNGCLYRNILIPNVRIEHLFLLDYKQMRLWIATMRDEFDNSINHILEFLAKRNKKEKVPELLLLVTPNEQIKYRYLTSGSSSIPLSEFYGDVIPSIKELTSKYPAPQILMDLLEERSDHSA